MDIKLQAKLLKLKGFLNEINHVSYTYSQFGKNHPMNDISDDEVKQLIEVYVDLLDQVNNLILNYGKFKVGKDL